MSDSGMVGLRRLERAGLNALPARHTIFLDGWIARVTGGSLRRANSVTCLHPDEPLNLAGRLDEIEAIYRRFNLPCIYRLTPLAPPSLEAALEERGYAMAEEMLVMTARLTPPLRSRRNYAVAPPDGWFDVLGTGMSAARLAEEQDVLSLVALPTYFILASEGGKPACCARFTLQGDLAGIFDLATIPEARRTGLARQVMFECIEGAGAYGARIAWLQVLASNHAAVALYRSLGFTEALRSHYRVPG
ncbi:MAG TPA: GNAT family N-acetyltransferase [Acetobacteraceae bacterium]|nr:GNAT family N-acetyltransferase [Acetobacteraceae bacterium]